MPSRNSCAKPQFRASAVASANVTVSEIVIEMQNRCSSTISHPDIPGGGHCRHRRDDRRPLLSLAHQKPDTRYVSPYECGFEAFADARSQVSSAVYLVASGSSFSTLMSLSCFHGVSLKDTGLLGSWHGRSFLAF